MFLALLLAGLALGAQGESLRGLNPDLAAQYSGSGGTFTCISGISKTIPFARVNDDYCDCADGSDEPGTPACHNGRFYCRNLGHEPRLLASAFVDDGVCDCCDGADEAKGKCSNTCLQASAVHREALKTRIAQYEQALATKADYVGKARAFKEDLQRKAGTIDQDVITAQAEVDRLRAEVSRLEAEEAAQKAAEEATRAAEQAAQEQAAPAEPQELNTGAEGATARDLKEEGQAATEEKEETPEERGRRIASQWTNDPDAAAVPGSQDSLSDEEEHQGGGGGDYEHQGGEHEDGDENPEEDQEPRPEGEAAAAGQQQQRAAREPMTEWEDFMMFLGVFKEWGSRWVKTIKTILKSGIRDEVLDYRQKSKERNVARMHEAEAQYSAQMEQLEQRARAAEEAATQQALQEQKATVASQRKAARRQRRSVATPASAPAAATPSDGSTPLGEVRGLLYDAEERLRQLEKDKENIKTYLFGGLDFGPNEVFLAFAEQCFTSSQTRWTYEACVFKTAVQREGYQNSVTVGRWQGFSPDYKQMLFTGGDECHNVGPRSFTVSMSCGMDNQLSDGEEPGTCAYVAKFASPALCNEGELIDLRNQLANLEAFEREVADKIAKDEL